MKYTSLNIIAMISVSCYILADTFFVSLGMGTYGLAALNFAVPVFGLIFGCGMMLGIGGATKYTILKSQGYNIGANQVFTNTCLLVLGFAAGFFVCGLFFADGIAALLGADGKVFEMTRDYLRVILLFSPIFLANNIMVCFVRNDGAPRLAMGAMVSSSLVNIALDYIFIFMLDLGMFGAALATGLANSVGLAILLFHIIHKRNGFELVKIKIRCQIAAGIFATGLPSFVTETSISVVMIVFNVIMLGLAGNVGVAAYGVIANIFIVVISIYNGIAQGIQPLISKYYGRKEMTVARLVLKYALILMALISLVVYLCAFLLANQISGVFNTEQNEVLQNLAVTGMRVYFTGCIFAGMNIILSIYFTSTENPRPAHVVSVLRGFVVILPLVFVLSHFMGVLGVWLAFPLAELAVGVAGVTFLFKNVVQKPA